MQELKSLDRSRISNTKIFLTAWLFIVVGKQLISKKKSYKSYCFPWVFFQNEESSSVQVHLQKWFTMYWSDKKNV